MHTHKGAPTSVSFPGEGPAVTSFVDGQLDLVYTGSGYDASVGSAGRRGRCPERGGDTDRPRTRR